MFVILKRIYLLWPLETFKVKSNKDDLKRQGFVEASEVSIYDKISTHPAIKQEIRRGMTFINNNLPGAL